MSATGNLKMWLPLAGCLEKRRTLIFAAAVLFAANLALTFPGKLNFDSGPQLAEAISGRYTDWHPPVMAWLWSWMLPAETGASSMLVFQLAFHWLGFLLCADALFFMGRKKTAWTLLLAGALPFFIRYNGGIIKDVGMASVFIAACGLVFWHRARHRPLPLSVVFLLILLSAYGTLVRTNAIFAVGPLLIYFFAARIRTSVAREWLTACLVVAVLALPISAGVNRYLLSAEDSGAIQSLLLFDLNGIANRSSDKSVLPPAIAMPPDRLSSCYTPYFWDTWSYWGACSFVWKNLGPQNSPIRGELKKYWISAVATHPLAYLEHRLKVFNSMTYFLVPARKCRPVPSCLNFNNDVENPETRQAILEDYFLANILVWPITWFAAGGVFLFLTRGALHDETMMAARSLAFSGTLYLGFMLVVGVATDIRYAYWSTLAVIVAIILGADARSRNLWHINKNGRRLIIAVALLLSTGMLTRLFDFKGFVS